MTQKYPLFSVLMSVYAKDRPAWVAQALDSVLTNTVKPTEVVVVIDGPIPEDLQAVLTSYVAKDNTIKLCPLAKNGGLGPALAHGLVQCSHELVARMDADDISLPDRFEKQLAYLEKNPNLSIVGGWIQEVDSETLEPVAIREVPCSKEQIHQFLKMRSPLNHVTVLFRKSAVLSAGNYQPFYCVEDYYLWARMVAKGFLLANIPDILTNVRVDRAMYGRRGGWKYFKSNLAISNKLRELGLISLPTQLWSGTVRFCVQILMPNWLRSYFYKKALR